MNNEYIEELIWRWQNHYKMLQIIKNSNIQKDQFEIWKNQIDNCFIEKIRTEIENTSNKSHL
jgi:hypothetical protein